MATEGMMLTDAELEELRKVASGEARPTYTDLARALERALGHIDATRAVDPGLYIVCLQGERGELVRLSSDAVKEAEDAAPASTRAKGKRPALPPAVAQLRAYLAVLEERDRPGLEAVDALLRSHFEP